MLSLWSSCTGSENFEAREMASDKEVEEADGAGGWKGLKKRREGPGEALCDVCMLIRGENLELISTETGTIPSLDVIASLLYCSLEHSGSLIETFQSGWSSRWSPVSRFVLIHSMFLKHSPIPKVDTLN